jgi:ketosteroid isomerase-like protein
MKRVALYSAVVCISGLFASLACAQASEKQQNVQLIRNLYAAFERGDVESVVALMDEKVIWDVPGPATIPFAGHFEGKQGVRKFFASAVSTLDVGEQKVTGFMIQGSKVGALGYERMVVKATGKDYRSNWFHLYTLRNGRIVRFEEFVDTAAQAAAFSR